ncbi:MAG: glutathione S-transferase family protein [Haliea sp.]|jgi:glutathione S-transferase|nr:glutathione S-transferase family protein [Haliea sp.]
MLTLYQRTDCPFCWKVRIALAELDIEYQSVDTVLGEKHPEVQRLSPTGTVPVLVDGDVVIWESAVIFDYLDSRYAPEKLISRDPAQQARERLLHVYSDKIVGGCLKEIVFEKRSKPESEWDADRIREGENHWHTCQTWLQQKLGTDPFFGARYCATDCALAARFGVAEAYGAAVNMEFPSLLQWYKAVTERPSWKKAYPTSFIRSE